MKIAVLGNGSIGLTTAYSLSKSGHKVVLFGDKEKKGSASKAAGAMINVMAEIEENFLDFEPTKKRFNLAYASQDRWKNFIEKNFSIKEIQSYKKKFTLVFKNNLTTPFESKQFEYLKKIKSAFPEDIIINQKTNKYNLDTTKINELICLPKEKYLDSRILLSKLEKLTERQDVIKKFDVTDYFLKVKKDKIEITYNKKKEIFDYVVVALGSYSKNFNKLNKDIIGKIPKIFFGTGTAFRIKKKKFTPEFKKSNFVLRTMNRGNACGFHLIPLNKDEYYFGASSCVTHIEETKSRIGTVAVLTNGLLNEFDNSLKDNHITLCHGHRPFSADTFPILGPLKKNKKIIYATANKRDGLTSSLEIAELINNFVGGDKDAFEEYKIFEPNRSLISYFDPSTAINKAAEASVAGFIMHEGEKYLSDWNKLVKKVKIRIEKVYKKLNLKNFGIHPELINLYNYKRI